MNVKSAAVSVTTIATIFFGAVATMQSVSDWPWDRSVNSAGGASVNGALTTPLDYRGSTTNDWPWD